MPCTSCRGHRGRRRAGGLSLPAPQTLPAATSSQARPGGNPISSRAAQAREIAASAAQYALLGGFAAVASGISSQGLTGCPLQHGPAGPWPYLLFFALDGAAGVCAVLLVRRAARAEWAWPPGSPSGAWSRPPPRSTRPMRRAARPPRSVRADAGHRRRTVRVLPAGTAAAGRGRADRKLGALRWLHPAERIRVQLGWPPMSRCQRRQPPAASGSTRQPGACTGCAGADPRARSGQAGAVTARQIRRAERRAHAALTRAGFADPEIAAEVLRQVQVLTLTPALARLDYTTADAARAAVGNLITHHAPGAPAPGPHAGPPARTAQPDGPADPGEPGQPPAAGLNGHSAAAATVIPDRPGQDAPALPASMPAPRADRDKPATNHAGRGPRRRLGP